MQMKMSMKLKSRPHKPLRLLGQESNGENMLEGNYENMSESGVVLYFWGRDLTSGYTAYRILENKGPAATWGPTRGLLNFLLNQKLILRI